MNPSLNFQDFSVVLAIQNYNPTLMTPDFLAGSGVVPRDWELSKQPVVSARATQLSFTNGVQIEAQPGAVSFAENLVNKDIHSSKIPDLVKKYAASLPNLPYMGVGINPRCLVTFGEGAGDAHSYLTEVILSRGSWQEFGTAPMQASVSLAYTLERCQLRLNINEARLQMPDSKTIPAILFAGNFSYSLTGESSEERLQNLNRSVENWQDDLATYRDLMDNYFLSGVKGDAVSLFPAPIL